LQQFEVHGPNDFGDAFVAMAKRGVDAVVILEDAVFVSNARAIADLAAKHRLPSAGFNEFAEAGGLIGYGVNFLEMYRRAAVYVDKILKGTKPAEFAIVANTKTAKALGLEIPQSLLARADEVIE
jgi:putative ABC transport system substrate-binding protein